MNQLNISIQVAIAQWELQLSRTTNFLNQLSDEALEQQIAPGKNSGKYIVGHLIAIHDALPKLLRVGEPAHAELFATYVSQPDGTTGDAKTIQELRNLWVETHDRVTLLIKNMPEADWLEPHNAITDEDFAVNPLRNRLSVLLNRTNHFAYHLGQLRLLVY